MPTVVADRLISWASDIEPGTLAQAHRAARLPIVHSHVALMPDAHIGIGATVGSVIPTLGAIIPSAVGVDIGCGMIAVETDLDQGQLPDRIDPLLDRIARTVPAGVGRGRTVPTRRGDAWLANHRPASDLTPRQARAASDQLGSLGSGNHFLEVCVDERGRVWVVLHSGSRGVGNQLATRHIAEAKASFAELVTGGALEDPDLAWFVQGTEAFDRYVRDMLWAQDYALENREIMMDRTLREVFAFVGHGREQRRINCHHNFAVPEEHGGVQVWVTRKGAIRAQQGDLGVIPGSMGAKTYIVRGKGNALSFDSCSHGAGRRLSRAAAKRAFDAEDLAVQMAGKVWLSQHAGALVDEIPSAYKDISQVMDDQTDLVEVLHVLTQILNYKGC